MENEGNHKNLNGDDSYFCDGNDDSGCFVTDFNTIKLTVIRCDMKTRNNWIYTYNMDYHQRCSHCAPFLQIPTTFQLPPFLAPLIGSIATSRFSFGEATLSAKMR